MVRRIRELYLNIRKVFYYLPVIWRDRYWDHSFIWLLMAHKLKRCEDYFREYGMSVGHKDQAKQIKICRLLIERMASEDYGENPKIGELKDLNYFDLEDFRYQQDMDYLFRMMKKHLRSWWD